MQTLIDLDTTIFLYLNSLHNSYMDMFMMMFSAKFTWVPMYLAFAWMTWRSYSWKTTLTVVVACVALIALADQTCATLIRPYVERLRPSRMEGELWPLVHVVNEYRGGMFSFPSCHAANSFAFAVFASLLVRKWRFTLFVCLWALINSYSRIYLGVHYPGDLLVGSILGALMAWGMYYVALVVSRRLTRSRNPFAMPVMYILWGYEMRPWSIVALTGLATAIGIAIASGVMCCQ